MQRPLVQFLWGETHVPKVVGSNPGTVYWVDIFHIYLLLKNCDDVCYKKPKINDTRGRGWPIFLKKLMQRYVGPKVFGSKTFPSFNVSTFLSFSICHIISRLLLPIHLGGNQCLKQSIDQLSYAILILSSLIGCSQSCDLF